MVQKKIPGFSVKRDPIPAGIFIPEVNKIIDDKIKAIKKNQVEKNSHNAIWPFYLVGDRHMGSLHLMIPFKGSGPLNYIVV